MTFRDIIGHRRLVRLLMRAAHAESLPPSLVFAGPEGVGKRQAALALAQALNCLSPVTPADAARDGCGECAACRKISRGLHPDVIVVEPEGGLIAVDRARDAAERTAYRPFEGRTRVVVLDDADLMNDAAQNALLKTLEEPPARNVFVLVTARPNILLPTVRSRCCLLRFAPLSASDVAAALAGRHGMSERAAQAAAALGGGSLGRALRFGAAGGTAARAAAVAALNEAAAAPSIRARLEVGASLLKASAKKPSTVDRGGKGQSDRASLAACLRAMETLLRDLAVLTTRAPEAALVNLDLRAELEPLARRYDRGRLGHAFSAVGRSLLALERNASPKIVVDWLALQL
ncbi:MAG TPA: DNA polymerase III subunit delta' [Vicinamibacterales bacterium]|nr:DNA polymerase III subunit delta' [Vicinamibacterales bacterium]HOQ59592.1 DNA polymerase III subunit delta' [Vicinamibacterales bacterium]HPK70990.1 DNA polymerase III subunit delta' [Vicinamibacterales bacterium]